MVVPLCFFVCYGRCFQQSFAKKKTPAKFDAKTPRERRNSGIWGVTHFSPFFPISSFRFWAAAATCLGGFRLPYFPMFSHFPPFFLIFPHFGVLLEAALGVACCARSAKAAAKQQKQQHSSESSSSGLEPFGKSNLRVTTPQRGKKE